MGDPLESTRAIVARAAVAKLAATAPEPLELLHEAFERIGMVVPFEVGGWMTLDPDSLLPSNAPHITAPGDMSDRLWRNELLTPDTQKFADLASAQIPVAALSELDPGEAERSERCAIMRSHGVRDEARMVMRSNGAAWGAGCLLRGDDPFRPEELRYLEGIAGIVGHGLQLGLARRSDVVEPPITRPAIVTLGLDLRIASATAEARRLMGLLPGDPGPPLFSVALRACDGDRDARVRVRLSDTRWLVLQAEYLQGAGPRPDGVALTLEEARGSELSSLVLRLHGLTARERQVGELLLTGLTTDELAARLFISPHTLRGHVKSIFAKVGASSRSELTALVSHSAIPEPSTPRKAFHPQPADLARVRHRLLELADAA